MEHYSYQNVWEQVLFGDILVEGGIPETGDLQELAFTEVQLVGNETERLDLLLSETEQVYVHAEVPEVIEAPVEAGSIVGKVSYYLNGEIVQIYPVAAVKDVGRITLPWCLERILGKYKV